MYKSTRVVADIRIPTIILHNLLRLFRSINKHWLLRTEFKVPLRLVSRTCGYKYVLLHKNGKPSYEELVEFTWSGYGIMNRCLVIEDKYAVENSRLNKITAFEGGGVSWRCAYTKREIFT